MSALTLDGFAHYGGGTALMLSGVYADLGNAHNLRIGVPAYAAAVEAAMLGCDPNTGAGFADGPKRVLATAKAALVVACRFSMDALPLIDNAVLIHAAYDASHNLIAWLGCDTDGDLTLYDASNAVLAAAANAVTAGAVHHLEFKYTFGAGGSCGFVLRVDDLLGTDTPAITSSTLTFSQTGNVKEYRILGQQLGASVGSEWLSELMIRDTLGSVNNGFMGAQYRVGTLPITNTTPLEFPSPAAIALTFPPPPPTTTAIAAADLVYLADRGTGAAGMKSSLVGETGASTDGGTNALSATPTFYHDIYETDPSGGAVTPTMIVYGGGLLTRTT